MTTELFWLTLTVTLTGLFWMPYVANRMLEIGVMGAMRNPTTDAAPKAAWAERMIHAHSNAVENLMIFAPLVGIAAIANISTPTTVAACQLYFFARLAHYLIYTFGIPFLRTVAFIAGFVAQMTLAAAILGAGLPLQ
ncbi:MAPEG family protein [Acaryochloris marina]|uniref:Conserved hypothetical membrane protein n=1 Tax=Acaryochloris marina (strain MBIC 11017) TaxID=329726 RepID=A8ZMX2_ACAM1|nr:MAPEG family protein [Acaryochloris marina]ABW32171.1 conserved hypothetical membrane protein [Acaryochloris marina MBIC11017]